MLPVAETGDGLPRAGSVQLAAQVVLGRFQESLYRQSLRLSALDRRSLGKILKDSTFGDAMRARDPSAGFDCHRRRSGFFGRSPELLPEKFRPEAQV
jgi:hypothetical protein